MSLKSLEAHVTSVLHDFKVGVSAVASFLDKHEAQIKTDLSTGAAIVGAVDPALAAASLAVSSVGETALGSIIAAVDSANEATLANGVNVQLDAATAASIKSAIATIKTAVPNLTNPAAAAANPAVSPAIVPAAPVVQPQTLGK